jgi:thiol:disulfide interchange protein DsbD
MMRIPIVFMVTGLSLWCAPRALQGFAAPEQSPVTAELIAEHASIQPGGRTRVGVHFDLEEGWHIYAKEPGDAGLPTKVTWHLLPEATFGPLQWPKPQEFIDPGDIRTVGYSGTVVLYSLLTITTQVPADRLLPIVATVEWLACRDVCVPGATTLELSLPVSSTPPALSTHAELFEHVAPET